MRRPRHHLIKFSLITGLILLSTTAAATSWTSGTKAPGDYTADGAVTIDGSVTFQPGTYTFDSLTVSSGRTLTIQGDSGTNTGVIINANNINVQSTATISANGNGYGADQGPGKGANHPSTGGGGGYGGVGGNGSGAGGAVYGSAFTPIDLGSGGGGSTGGTAGRGGGAIKLVASGTLTMNGTITANGTNGGTWCGGGSGGSIWIDAVNFDGNGILRVNGGNGQTGAGGGGGGRILIAFGSSNTFSGTMSANNGTGGSGASKGSIAILNTSTNDVFCDGAVTASMASTDFPVPMGGLVVRGGCVLTLLDGVSSVTGVTVSGSGSTLNLNGDLTTTITGSIDVNSAGLINVKGNRLTGLGYTITAAQISVDATSMISANGLGFTGGQGPGAGGSGGYPGGGGYGGNGGTGNFNGEPGGSSYGSAFAPTDLGSGGGGSGPDIGGSGGGAIKLVVSSTLTLDGTLSANGVLGDSYTGGGSGGSIWIVAGTFSGGGSVTANGGNGRNGAGGGGGGRLLIEYSTTDSFSGTATTNSGTGGSGAESGSVIFKHGNDIFIKSSTAFPAGSYSFNSLTVMNNAILTLASDLSSGTGVLISAGNVTVMAGSKITADGLGHPEKQGPGAGGNESGGGYGGRGGNSQYYNGGGTTYGSEKNPVDLGSGGGSASSHVGGSGGGAIKFLVSGTLTVDGTVSANGTNGQGSYAGGGSGGSIWIIADTLAGAGTISVNGGNRGGTTSGGGGGGRIAVYFGTNNFTGSMTATKGTTYSGATGSANGTVYLDGIGAATALAFTQQPSPAVHIGIYLSRPPQVSAVDSNGTTVVSYSDPISIAAYTDENCTVPATGTFTHSSPATESGMAWYTDVSYSAREVIYIGATSGSVAAACSSAISVSKAATKLIFTTQPSATGTAWVNLSQQPVVKALDDEDYADTIFTDSINLSAYTNDTCTTPAAGSLGGNSIAAVAGIANYTGVRFSKKSVIYLKATAAGLSSDCSTAIDIAAGAAAKVVYYTQPSATATAGENFAQQPVVRAEDNYGNAIDNFTGTVTLKAYTNGTCMAAASGGTLNGDTATGNGTEAAFTGVNYTKAGDIYLRASSPGLSNDCSTRVRVSAGAPAALEFSLQPSATGVMGVSLKTPPKVTVLDAYGNTVTDYATPVVLSPYLDVGCNSVASGTLNSSVNLASGIANFSSVRYSKDESIYMKATSGALTPACSSQVTLLKAVPMFFRGY